MVEFQVGNHRHVRLRLVVLLVLGGYFNRRPTSETNKSKDIAQPAVNVTQGPGM